MKAKLEINTSVLSTGEQIFLSRIIAKERNGQLVRPNEKQFVKDMQLRTQKLNNYE